MTVAALVAVLLAQTDGGVAAIGSLFGAAARASDGGAPSPFARPRDLPFEVDLRAQAKLTKEEIRAAIQKRTPAVRRCYEQALVRDRPDSSGSLTVGFTIGPAGTVTSAEIRDASPTFSPAFTQCVLDAMKTITTAPPRGGGEVKVRYPFTFKQG
ncbi:MAG: TonB family protein [Myxococcaceae bacterium]|nr:TonB family protein [Myxococcaceae bacterium]